MAYIEIALLLTIVLFAVKAARDSASLLWLLQVKEYRLDRLRSHWRENARINLSDLDMALGILIMLAVLFPETFQFLVVSLTLVLGALAPFYLLGGFFRLLQDLRRRTLKRPRLTKKMLLIVLVYILFYALFALGLSFELLRGVQVIYSIDFLLLANAYLLLLNACVPVFILLSAVLVTPFSERQKRQIVQRARFKMTGLQHVKTIGITGSYGKTSTKEFLCAILAHKFKVVKTAGNNNTLMGVADTVLREVSDDFDFFVCEMGAYRRGEIAEICAVARPWGGILTGINEQHLDLFGSLENTKRGKFELLENLPEEGFAVVNEKAQALPPQIPIKTGDVSVVGAGLATDVLAGPDTVEFTYEGMRFRADILGKHYIENLVAAMTAARKLGMSLEEIQAAVSAMDIESDYLMHKLEGPEGSTFIDDSYSANRSGVAAALDYLQEAYPDKKRLFVFPGIIELGGDSARVHEEIWGKACQACQGVFLLMKEDQSLAGRYPGCPFIFEKDFDRMKAEIASKLDRDTAVLFESRGAGVVMRKLLNVKENDA